MSNDEYSVKLNEKFGPVPTYKQYLTLYTVVWGAFLWFVVSCCYVFIPDIDLNHRITAAVITLVPVIVLSVIWSALYFKTVHYVLNETEITWERGIWFHKTGIVPYNRITDVMISQGPIMRIFGISHVGIQTAGGGNPKGGPEVQIEGQLHAAELREIIMDHVRESKNAGAATIGVAETNRAPAAPKSADNGEILEELRKIRELLEKKN